MEFIRCFNSTLWSYRFFIAYFMGKMNYNGISKSFWKNKKIDFVKINFKQILEMIEKNEKSNIDE